MSSPNYSRSLRGRDHARQLTGEGPSSVQRVIWQSSVRRVIWQSSVRRVIWQSSVRRVIWPSGVRRVIWPSSVRRVIWGFDSPELAMRKRFPASNSQDCIEQKYALLCPLGQTTMDRSLEIDI
jgi:hypothetical protein